MFATMRLRLERRQRGKSRSKRSPARTPNKTVEKFSAIARLENLVTLPWIMPPLNGQMLEVPNLLPVCWKEGQLFQIREDPERISEAWLAPDFVWSRDPVEQSAKTVCTNLPIHNGVPGRRFAKVISKVLDEACCSALLADLNAKGFTPTLVTAGCEQKVLRQEAGSGHQGHQVTVDSPELAAWLMEVLRPHLPTELDGCSLVDLSERFQCLCYMPGEAFPEHMDGCCQRLRSHHQRGAHSRVSIQIYLHDVPRSHGGALTFCPGRRNQLTVQPRAGTAVIFTQDLLHEGSLLLAGLKYTLRADAMYQVIGCCSL